MNRDETLEQLIKDLISLGADVNQTEENVFQVTLWDPGFECCEEITVDRSGLQEVYEDLTDEERFTQ